MLPFEQEAIDIATRLGRAYCRTKDIPLEYHEDCIQEGIETALRVLPKWNPDACKLATHLYPWVRGAIGAYRAKLQNGGMGGKDAPITLVSLHDEVPGAQDFDDEPLTYEDILSYHTPPRGYGDPVQELIHNEEDSSIPHNIIERLLDSLSEADRVLIKRYFGMDGPEAGQLELALEEDVTRQAISRRITRIINRLAERARDLGFKF